MTDFSAEVWIEKSLQGDEEAFAHLVEYFRPRIFQACLAILKDANLAEDATQECFIRAYKHLNEFERRSSLYTWLYRIAHNVAIDLLKKERPHGELQEEITGKETLQKETLQPFVAKLPRKQRCVVELYYFEGLSQKQIAAQLQLPYGTVRSRLYYARKRLKSYLKGL